ncbi:PI-PLC X domain-containing protein 1 [Hypsizygus marmoreus]|uniref:PI-PLC X domain-containing protein 1 n=1 Tax=Hypsizygus marmoreus TaxID=39966 RepID=A0A369JCC4_HYPMA|nr:PI-PLC X domain-containing protein 1 [Hypsizygus marmoreus]
MGNFTSATQARSSLALVNQSFIWHFISDCLLFDGGKVVDYLKLVKAFLDANPNEVLTLLFTNPEGLSVQDEWKPLFDDASITPLAYVPPTFPMKYSQWPTLGEMIDSGKRVVIFMDSSTDTSQVDFIIPEFEIIWETPFSVTNSSFPCSIDRIHGPLPASDHVYMINHSLNKDLLNTGIIVSDPVHASTTNGVPSIIDHVNRCVPLSGANRAPSFILLDFVNIGDGFEAADKLNGIAVARNETGQHGAHPQPHENAAHARASLRSTGILALHAFLLTTVTLTIN